MPAGDQISYFLNHLTDALSDDIKLYIASSGKGSPVKALKGQLHIFQCMYVKDDLSKLCPAVNIRSVTCKYPSTILYGTKAKNTKKGDLYTTIGEEDVKLVLRDSCEAKVQTILPSPPLSFFGSTSGIRNHHTISSPRSVGPLPLFPRRLLHSMVGTRSGLPSLGLRPLLRAGRLLRRIR